MKTQILVNIVLAATIAVAVAGNSKKCKPLNLVGKISSGAKVERKAYKEAKKKLANQRASRIKQEKVVKKLGSPSIKKALDPNAMGGNVAGGRSPFEDKKYKEAKALLEKMKKNEAGWEKIVRERKAAYEAAKKRMGAWR